MAHGAALIALTIDEVGMAKTRERKLEVAQRIDELVCDEHGMDPELLIFDALTFTLTTGDEEWKPSAVETIEGIRLIKSELPGREDLARRLQRLLRHRPARARGPELRLPAPLRRGRARPRDGQPEPHHALRRDPARPSASSPTTSSSTAATTRWSASSQHFEAKGPEAEAEAADPTAGMEPEEALHWHILRRKKDGVEAQIDASVEKIGAVPTLNDVLLPAMKEVGDKFGAGELILPFVLQSAEVMKRAVAQLEQYLDKLEGYTKGTVVLATVFGDVHDIGKSLVNTILTNNGYTVVDLGKQVPIATILDAAKEHDATAIGLSALLVSHLQADAAGRPGAARAGPRVPGAARRRRDQPQVRAARAATRAARSPTTVYDPGVFYCKDAFEGLAVMDRLVEPERARASSSSEVREAAARAARGRARRRRCSTPPTTPCARAVAHRRRRSPSRRSGACARSRSTATSSTPTSTPTCCSSCTGAGAA